MHVNGCISSNLSDVFPSLPFQDPNVNGSLNSNRVGVNSTDGVSRLKYLGLNMPSGNFSANSSIFFNEDRSRTNLIINYLPQSYDQNDLQRLFERVGPIRQCKLIRDKNTGASLCYGFVDFVNTQHAALAIQTYHGYETEQKRLRVAYASSGGRRFTPIGLAHRLPSLSNGSSVSGVLGGEVTNENVIGWEIFVIGIPLECTEVDLHRLFSSFGAVIFIRLLPPQLSDSPPIQKTRMSPNFNGTSSDMSSDSIEKLTTSATVIFEEKSSAEMAILRLNGYQGPEWTAPMRLRVIGSVTRETYGLFCNPRRSPLMGISKINGHINDPLTESDVFGNMINRRVLNNSNCTTNGNIQLSTDITKQPMVMTAPLDVNLNVCSNHSYSLPPRPIIRNKTLTDSNSLSAMRDNLSANSFDLLDVFDNNAQTTFVGDRFLGRDVSLMNSLNQHMLDQEQSKVENSLRAVVTSQSSLWSVSQHRSVLHPAENGDVSDGLIQKRLSVKTPLLHSAFLTNNLYQRGANINVWLKLENIQPTGSFKIRGTEKVCRKWSAVGVNHIICPATGNVAIAAAFAARAYGITCTLIVPEPNESFVRKRLVLEALETRLIVHGSNFSDAHRRAEQLLSELQQTHTSSVRLLHPYEQSELWEGYESIVDEVEQEISQPDAIVVSVGGGGLLTGVVQGLWNKGWTSTHVIGMETEGADCFNRSWRTGQIVVSHKNSSVASSLNAPVIASRTWNLSQCHFVSPVTCTDLEAVEATINFLDDHGMLVEPSCGAALTTVYSGYLARLQHEGRLPRPANVVVVISGGRNITLRQLIEWETHLTSVVSEQITASLLTQPNLFVPRAVPHSICQTGIMNHISASDQEESKITTPKSMTPRIVCNNRSSNNSDGDNQSNHNDRDVDLNTCYSGALNPHDLVNFSKLLSTPEIEDDK